jgi:hypothetical protein
MTARQVLIITGTGRSGTSWVAGAFRATGFMMGEQLLGAGRGNAFGHFEDRDFLRWHQDVLNGVKAEGVHRYGVDEAFPAEIPVGADQVLRAQALIESRNKYSCWGFKDPRAIYLLDFWKRLLPEAKVICLYRDPLDTCMSMFNRGDGFANLGGVFRLFGETMQRALQFKSAHTDWIALCNIDRVIAAPEEFEQVLHTRFGIQSEGVAENLKCTFVPNAFSHVSASRETIEKFGRLFPDTLRTYSEIELNAEMPMGTLVVHQNETSGLLDSKRQVFSTQSGVTSPHLYHVGALVREPISPTAGHSEDVSTRGKLQQGFFVSLISDSLDTRDLRYKVVTALLENIQLIGKLYESHSWLEGEVATWRRVAEERELVIQEQQRRLEKIDSILTKSGLNNLLRTARRKGIIKI